MEIPFLAPPSGPHRARERLIIVHRMDPGFARSSSPRIDVSWIQVSEKQGFREGSSPDRVGKVNKIVKGPHDWIVRHSSW